jgi:hypothetical protein
MLAGTRIKFLFQVLHLINYMSQGASKRSGRFQVLVSVNNLRITKLQAHAIEDTRQVFIPNVATYKLQIIGCFKKLDRFEALVFLDNLRMCICVMLLKNRKTFPLHTSSFPVRDG